MKLRTIGDITAALRAEGFPMELVRGEGYLYFIWDDAVQFETHSVPVCYFNHLAPRDWLAEGKEFAAIMRRREREL